MWERCAAAVTEMGGSVVLDHCVTGLETEGNRVVAATVTTKGGSRRIEAEHFITTMSLRSLLRALGPVKPADVVEAAEQLAYRDFVLVALMLDHEHLFADNWIYVHTPGVQVGRIQNFNNWSKAMVPYPGQTCLGMEYFCFEGDSLWVLDDAGLIELATSELRKLGIASGAQVIDGTVVRMRKAYPIYNSSYRTNLETIRRHIDPIANLHTVGRNGMHKYNNQDHSMYTAMLAVENMQGASHDLWEVNTDLEYHEEQRLAGSESRATAAA